MSAALSRVGYLIISRDPRFPRLSLFHSSSGLDLADGFKADRAGSGGFRWNILYIKIDHNPFGFNLAIAAFLLCIGLSIAYSTPDKGTIIDPFNMANPGQCYYCFECLSASYDDIKPISLPLLEDLWEQHEQVKELATLQAKGESASFGENDDLSQHIVEEDEEDYDGPPSKARKSRPGPIQPPSFSRLQSDVSADSSSASTTPSSQSVSSASTAITTPGSDPTGLRQQRQSERHHPLFVTWNTVSKSGHKSLRGCIGTFEAQELSAGLRSYALTSALDDSRFSPIPESLLPSLSCSLTLLGSFETCADAMDWDLGTHGLRISFIYRNRRYGATYLPDVPVEQGWTKEETVESLMRKSGWEGATGIAKRILRASTGSSHNSNSGKPWEQVSDFRAVRYQGLKASASYSDWQEWRKWVLSLDDGREKLLESVV